MSRPARIKGVVARFDGGKFVEGTVTIDRERMQFSARPSRRRRTFDLPLGIVVDMVCLRVVKAELAQAKREKAEKRRRK